MILKIAYRPLSGYEQPFCKKFCKTDTPLSWTALNHFFLLLGLLICANSSLSVLFRPSIRISLSSIREFKSSHLWKPSNFLCGTCVYSLYPELYIQYVHLNTKRDVAKNLAKFGEQTCPNLGPCPYF